VKEIADVLLTVIALALVVGWDEVMDVFIQNLAGLPGKDGTK
jgi:hypothetical protein